ncbi:MAG: glycosyltransferase [Prevotella sp.]|jgi:glycosyltransferase involved in cell wall biosynthesis|nr:glycosyltransferase [Prevotella sp.]MCI1281707.1 glycosyltransferase [Prevotella sp.]
MKTSLSILIPTRNDKCLRLVKALSLQANKIQGLQYEIIVADDGSTDKEVIAENKAISGIDDCHYIIRGENVGRSAIRNYLSQIAHQQWLLFIDGDMSLENDDFLRSYLQTNDEQNVVYGGYKVNGNAKENLRYKYEKHSEKAHSLNNRLKHPNKDFHTSNFLIHKELMLQYPLDKQYRGYGYEDVAYGKFLQETGITISHIDNPVVFNQFENNEDFINKTEESIRTLKTHQKELRDYSRIIRLADNLEAIRLSSLVRRLFQKRQQRWRMQLCGSNPSLFLFNLYKIGYYL